MKLEPVPLSQNEIANGYLLCRDNSERLINDATILFSNNAFLSSISICRLANEEIAKARILWISSKFVETDIEKWKWFYKALNDHKEKLNILENDIHMNIQRNEESSKEIITKLKKTRENTIYVWLENGKFSLPGSYFYNIEYSSNIELEYSKKLHHFVFLAEYLTGKSSIQDIVLAFKTPNISLSE
jgi:AbiV family abortive infection protein